MTILFLIFFGPPISRSYSELVKGLLFALMAVVFSSALRWMLLRELNAINANLEARHRIELIAIFCLPVFTCLIGTMCGVLFCIFRFRNSAVRESGEA